MFSDPGIVPLPQHRVDFSDAHSGGKHLKPKAAAANGNANTDLSPGGGGPPEEDWTICTRGADCCYTQRILETKRG